MMQNFLLFCILAEAAAIVILWDYHSERYRALERELKDAVVRERDLMHKFSDVLQRIASLEATMCVLSATCPAAAHVVQAKE